MSGVGGDQVVSHPNTSHPKDVRRTFGRTTSLGLIPNSSSTSSYVAARPVTTIQSTQNSRNRTGTSSKRRNGANEELLIEDIIEDVFLNAENKDRIKKNLAIMKESRLNKVFVTFNGRDVKSPSKDFKESLTATFGEMGYEIYIMLDRLIWVSCFSITINKRFNFQLILTKYFIFVNY